MTLLSQLQEQFDNAIDSIPTEENKKKKRKPPCAYINFVKEQSILIRKENPYMKFADIAKEVSVRWNNRKII